MISKETLLKQIDSFPSMLSIEELIEKLIFVEKLERRIAESKQDETLTEDELEKEIKTWFK